MCLLMLCGATNVTKRTGSRYVSNVPGNRVHGTQQGSPGAVRRPSATPATLHASVLSLHRNAGNRAVARLLARKVGWTDASEKGRAWNKDEQAVGKIRRIPLEGLGEGLSASRRDELAKRRWVWDDQEPHKKGHWEFEGTRVAALSSEGAKGKAIVLVPDGLDAAQPIEVLVFLHGFTEDTGRPFAGWRALDVQPKGASKKLQDLRRGVDPADLPGVADTAPVRDVALDQAEQQLQESGRKQLVIVLPQGGLHSQFSKDGGMTFDSDAYIKEVVTRLQTEGRWKEAGGKLAKKAPDVSRVIMSGHSGAGAALSTAATAGQIKGDLVLYDAINGGQLDLFKDWVRGRLEEDLVAIKHIVADKSKTDADVLKYLQDAQKLRGYTTDAYISQYLKLDDAIQTWFDASRTELGKFAGCLRRNYFFEYHNVHHEELMRGSDAANKRAPGTGTILDAINALHAPQPTSAASCPMPMSLRERWTEIKAQEKERAAQEKKRKEQEKLEDEQRRRAEKRKAKAGAR